VYHSVEQLLSQHSLQTATAGAQLTAVRIPQQAGSLTAMVDQNVHLLSASMHRLQGTRHFRQQWAFEDQMAGVSLLQPAYACTARFVQPLGGDLMTHAVCPAPSYQFWLLPLAV
jgi:hypothetical protein